MYTIPVWSWAERTCKQTFCFAQCDTTEIGPLTNWQEIAKFRREPRREMAGRGCGEDFWVDWPVRRGHELAFLFRR